MQRYLIKTVSIRKMAVITFLSRYTAIKLKRKKHTQSEKFDA